MSLEGAVKPKGRVIPTIVTLAAFGVLIALGSWQLERRTWKNDLIARFESALVKAPVDYQPPKAPEFERVKIKGEFLNAQTSKMLIPTPESARAKTADGFGYLLFTPLKFQNGIVFVNRGFVPQSLADEVLQGKDGEVQLTGIVREPQKPGWFTPAANPAQHLYFAADIPSMAAAASFEHGQVIVGEYIEAEQGTNGGVWPLGRDPRQLLAAIPNNHLQYALTWFGLAAALVGVFAFYIAQS